jgi:GH35 family endo-1,4-beta-xylanase
VFLNCFKTLLLSFVAKYFYFYFELNKPVMSYSRRLFIKKSSVGLSGVLAGVSAIAGPTPTKLKYGNLLFGFSSENAVLDEAKKSIINVRQRDTMIQFLNKTGLPLSNHNIEIEQLDHEFLFGDNNWTMSAMVRNGMGNTDRLKYYRKRFSEILNTLNTTVYWTERPRNDAAKTQDFQGEVQWDDFEESVNWANAHGLTAKGHPMYWTVPKAIPDWLANYPYETHMKFVEVRIRNLAARFKNRVKIWDAVNEMLWEPHPKNLAKREWPYWETSENMVDYIGKVIKWAREEDPNALYTINDYGLSSTTFGEKIAQNGKMVNAQIQRKRYIELMQRLGDAGVSPNLMGIQCHTGWLSPVDQMTFYDEMSEAGIPLTVTEFWANTKELKNISQKAVEGEEWRNFAGNKKYENLSDAELEEIRDQYILNYLTCAFGHPNIDSFYFWGFVDLAVDFKNEYNSSHEMKPIFHKVNDLINKQWKTRLNLKTDHEGKILFRGFCGNYSAKLKPANGPAIGHRFAIQKNHDVNSVLLKTTIG